MNLVRTAPSGSKTRGRFLATSALALGSIGLVRGPAKAAQFEFKCASNNPVDNPTSIRLSQMWAAIEQESGGRVHCQFFPNSQLGGDAAMLTQLRLGALQYFLVSAATFASVVPAANIGFLGYAFKDADEGPRVMDGGLGAYIRQEAAAKGVYVFRSVWNNGMSQIEASARPIRTPDDLHNFKIRIPESKILVDLFKVLGAVPTPLSMGETYTSMQTRVIDGVSLSMDTFETARLYEVSKYVSLTDHGWAGPWLIANGAAWKSLPPDLQDIIERNALKYTMLQRRDNKVASTTVQEKLRTQGMVFNRPASAAFRARLSPYFKEWAEEFGPTQWGLLESGLGHKLI